MGLGPDPVGYQALLCVVAASPLVLGGQVPAWLAAQSGGPGAGAHLQMESVDANVANHGTQLFPGLVPACWWAGKDLV